MSEPLRRASAWTVAVVVTLAIVALSQISYTAEDTNMALIRLSWRARGERVEKCREPTEEEQRQVPQHMRQREICEGRIASYLLRAVVDGEVRVGDTIRSSGARGDRPLYINRDISVEAIEQEVAVTFVRLDAASGEAVDERTVPRSLQLDTLLAPEPGQIVLITYDAEMRRLVIRPATAR